MGHFRHDHNIGFHPDHLFNVEFAAGLDFRNSSCFLGIVAVGAPADDGRTRTDGVKNLAVGRHDHNDAFRRTGQCNFTAHHVGYRDAVFRHSRQAGAEHQQAQEKGNQFLGHIHVPPQKMIK